MICVNFEEEPSDLKTVLIILTKEHKCPCTTGHTCKCFNIQFVLTGLSSHLPIGGIHEHTPTSFMWVAPGSQLTCYIIK